MPTGRRSVSPSTERQRTHRRRCRWCQEVQPMKRVQQFCSPACAQEWRQWHLNPAQRRAQMRKAIDARVAAMRARRFRDLTPLAATDPEGALERAYQRGYQAGYSAGHRTGLAKADRAIARMEA